uniref:amino acid adenylation domain-containing protein n=1 Tax=Stenotrophomonas sp. GZD-301 TaxID=3404814 RepID=UPI003BB77B8B
MDITDLDLELLNAHRRSRRSEERAGISPVAGDQGPLSFAQSRLAYLQLLDPASSQYNMPFAFRVAGALDHAALRQAVAWLLDRHPVLRSGVHLVDGEPVQRIHPTGEVAIDACDLRDVPVSAVEGALRTWMAERAGAPFALDAGRMLRVELALLPGEQTLVLITMHHIASDGWSLGIFKAELSVAYAAFAEGKVPALPALPIRYLDFAAWEQRTAERDAERHFAYWQQQLVDVDSTAVLAYDQPRGRAAGSPGSTVALALDGRSSVALRALAREEGATGYAVAAAAFAVVLSRLGNAATVQFGTPTANRTRAETQGLVGFFVNMLVIRLQVDGHASFRALVRAARQTVAEAQSHQSVPYEQLVERLQSASRPQRSGLFQVVFSYDAMAAATEPMRFGPYVAVADALPHQTAKFDLTVNVVESGDALLLVAEYASDVFEHARIEAVCAEYRDTLEALLAAPDVPLAALFAPVPLQETLLEPQHCTADLFARLQAHPPQAIALRGETVLDYGTLLGRAARLATRLQQRGQGPGQVVGLLIEDSATLIVAMLACLRAGTAFLVLDTGYPAARLRTMLDSARCGVLLRQGAVPPLTAPRVLDLDASDTDALSAPGPVVDGAVSSILHTSGSTGKPKAVALPVSGLIQHALRMQQLWGLGPDDRVLQFNAPAFDAFVEEVFTALVSGACLLLPAQRLLDPRQFCSYVQTHAATILDLPTAYWHALTFQLDEAGAESLRGVRSVVVGGEAASADAVRKWLRLCPQAAWTNTYGPTEASMCVLAGTQHTAPSEDALPFGPPLGTALAGNRVHLLDDALRPVPDGAPGQLYIEGSGLAYGYIGRAGATAERFLPNPFGASGSRLYATGDLCRRDRLGQLLFLGRNDRQIKLNGHRIEPGEIETALMGCAGVRLAAVGVQRGENGEVALYACVAADDALTAASLQNALHGRLPAYMVPSRIWVTHHVPLTASGKIDHAAILAALSGPGPAHVHRAPENALQQAVATLWEEQLQQTRIGLDDDFFSIGGHSIAAIRFIARFNARFNADVALVVLLERPRLEDFCIAAADHLEARAGHGAPTAPGIPVHAGDEGPLSFAQSRLVFLQMLDPASSQYNLPYAFRVDGALALPALRQALAWLLERHAVLRTGIHLVDGEPVQRIHPVAPADLTVHDLRALSTQEAEAAVQASLPGRIGTPFRLISGTMLRADVYQLPSQRTLLLLNTHHVVNDGWSLGILMKELSTAYAAFVRGQVPLMPVPAIRYLDFAAWERGRPAGLDAPQPAESHAAPLVELLPDHPSPAVPTGQGATVVVPLPVGLAQALRGLSRDEGASRYAVGLAGFAACLARLTGAREVSVGTPTANREHPDVHALVGFFVNMLVVRLQVDTTTSFRQLVGMAKRVSLAAQAGQGIPYEQQVEQLSPSQRMQRSALFQVVYAYETGEDVAAAIPFGPHAAQVEALPHQTAKFDLTVNLVDTGDTLTLVAEYASDIFEHARIEAICAHYRDTLGELLAAPDVPLAALSAPVPLQEALPEARHSTAKLFARLQSHPPQAIALQGETVVDYATLLARLERLAVRLQQRGQGPGAAVGLLIEDRATLIVAMLACLRVGAAFLVLDADYPSARLRYMLDNGRSGCLLRQGAVPALEAAQVLDLDAPDTDRLGEVGPVVDGAVSSILHTSGSTGEPKAVSLPVSGLLQHALRMQQ